ncbi:MAG: hypothetical protein U0354_08195 [Candidatus Sericytochromatia bacterium]
MTYKDMPLYQKINSINQGVRDNLAHISDFRKDHILEFKKVLVGRSSYTKEPVGTEFDFVVFKKPNFVWSEQKSKEDVLLIAKVIYKNTIDSLKFDIEQELFKFHSVQALRKLLIIVDTKDSNTEEKLVSHFIKNYDVMLNFPPYIEESINFEKCPMCGTAPSKIEAWFYKESTNELLHIDDYSF